MPTSTLVKGCTTTLLSSTRIPPAISTARIELKIAVCMQSFHHSSSFSSSKAPALDISCRRMATILLYSFLLIIPFSSSISTRIVSRALSSSISLSSLPVIFFGSTKSSASALCGRCRLVLLLDIYWLGTELHVFNCQSSKKRLTNYISCHAAPFWLRLVALYNNDPLSFSRSYSINDPSVHQVKLSIYSVSETKIQIHFLHLLPLLKWL